MRGADLVVKVPSPRTSALGVGRDGTEQRLTAELVHVDEPQAAIVLLRPGDARAAEVLKAGLEATGNAPLPDATCDAGCNDPPCVYWGCDYVSSQGFHWGCFALPDRGRAFQSRTRLAV